ncbi:MAG: hypothetical protein KAU49_01250 [Candidatus Krumholzibacteria bacterium]|nr:hypothetical protein [Candidatus Krumholzibacteria bacterium]
MTGEFSPLRRYLHETLGIDIHPAGWDEDMLLPVFLRDLYTFSKVRLMATLCLLMLDNEEQEQSPATVRKHMDLIKTRWDGDVVYVRARVTAYNRKRLIERKLPFIVPGNQMYLPMLGIDLREHFKKLRTETHRFNPSTQALVIHVLLRGTAKRIYTPAEMAGLLGYSAMTMTRAFDELESSNVGEIFLEGRERYLRFSDPEKEIWAEARTLLRSPVKKRIYINPENVKLAGPRAGLTALADYTMLAEPSIPAIALRREDWKSLRQRHQVEEFPSREPGALELEIWSYAPSLFAEGGVVDRLSLYLSLKENKDERVEAALEEMMEGLNW